MYEMGLAPYNKTLIADGMVCVPYPQMDDLVRIEQKYRIAVRWLRQVVRRGYASPEDARLFLELLGEEMPETGKEEGGCHDENEELPYA